MAVYDETKGGTIGFPSNRMGHVFVMRTVLDCAEANAGSGLASGDSAQVLNLPANHHVMSVRAQVLEAEGATMTFDVGDSGSNTRWHNGLDGNATSTEAIDTTVTSGTAADDIRVHVNNAASKARIEVAALVADLNPDG